jgi:FKBP-type peptidyl-prolyl cis-trans isomerase
MFLRFSRTAVVPFTFLALVFSISCSEGKKQVTLASETDSLAYVLGMGYADYLKSIPVDVDIDKVLAGVRDAMAGENLLIAAADAGEIQNRLAGKIQAEQQKEQSAKNKKEGEDFLATNAKRSEVTTTASGLQYEVITKGEGPKPAETDMVRVHYRGTLLDGTEFDSSHKRGQPAEFKLNQVIKGWTEGLQLMPVGSKYKFYVPSELAYGERGAGGEIGPGAVLVFEVELLDIVK